MEKDASHGASLSERAYHLLRRDILLGVLLPEEKLQIEAMSERFGIGTVPLREALNRLSADGLVQRKNQRGFFVAPLALEDLEALVKTRVWLETKALEESIKNGDELWEEELVVAFHRLSRSARRLQPDVALELSEEWDIHHKDFHMALLSRCGSDWLIGFCSNMMDQAVRYRNISMNVHSSAARRAGAAQEHQAILDAALARDIPSAVALLTEHYEVTLSSLRSVFSKSIAS